jgi:uncharacterized membrane protein HdeD (DUF308 family)
VKFWIILFRGLLAIILGVVLVFYPDKTRWILGNFMGMFWLVSGFMSLRWNATGERARGWALVAGIVGVLAGIGMLSRGVASRFVAEDIVIGVVGLIILLTGLLHMFGGFRQDGQSIRRWSWTGFLLGVFEAVLGLLLIIEPLERGPIVYTAATLWALLGGLILIGDALRVRRQSQVNQPGSPDKIVKETEQT